MRSMTIENICRACAGELVGNGSADTEAACVVLDSRKIEPGGVFIATKGERVDGHSFIPQVFEKGALAVVCEEAPADPAGPCIVVKDSFKALTDIAAFYREQLSCKFIGITGSVGKTSTKEMTAAVLKRRYKVCSTEGNFNNEIGVPLTILRIRDDDECAVVEMGINHFGEMSRLTALVRPDIAIITSIGECHLEAFHNRDGVLKAKTEIFEGMSDDAVAVLNGEDDKLITVKRKSTIFYSHNDMPDTSFISGKHMQLNAHGAAAVGRLLGVNDEDILDALKEVQTMSGRGGVIKCQDYNVIDDCYNANPTSVRAAIDALCENYSSDRVAILGDMFELGENEIQLHAGIGKYAKEKGVEQLIAVGGLSKNMADAYGDALYYESTDALLDALSDVDLKGKNILVKASHGMHFERVVEALTKA